MFVLVYNECYHVTISLIHPSFLKFNFILDVMCSLSLIIGQDCPAPAPITNGEIQGTVHAVGSKITYICNSGYELNGSKTRTCGTNHQWWPSAPTCTS